MKTSVLGCIWAGVAGMFLSFHAMAGSCGSLVAAMRSDAQSAAKSGSYASRLQLAALTGDISSLEQITTKWKSTTIADQQTSKYAKALDKALYGAAMAGEVKSIQTLVKHGANVNDLTAPPLMAAAECGQIDSMAALVDAGANTSIRSTASSQANVPQTPLETALGGGQIAAASWLLAHGADTCSRDAQKRLSRLIHSPAVEKGMSTQEMKRLQCR